MPFIVPTNNRPQLVHWFFWGRNMMKQITDSVFKRPILEFILPPADVDTIHANNYIQAKAVDVQAI